MIMASQWQIDWANQQRQFQNSVKIQSLFSCNQETLIFQVLFMTNDKNEIYAMCSHK